MSVWLSMFFLLIGAIPLAANEEEFDLVETKHTLTLSGREPLPYIATTGTLPVSNEQGDAVAELFFISYTVPE
jgi:carboxypeptidase C (cathepsin A)